MQTDTLPGISIIVPAYNAETSIRQLLQSLQRLEYPTDSMEILIIDNGSTDRTVEFIRESPVTLLEEREQRSSYGARNRGVRQARHGILAFTDADCVVTPSWLREGVKALASADLAAGKVEFTFSPRPAAAELFDAIHHMQNDELIRKYSGAATANLFVRAALFRKLGPFRADVRSGGDMMWTRAATRAGLTLVYAPSAVVRHPARRLLELLIKAFRLGTGTYQLHREQKIRTPKIIYEVLRSLLPRHPGKIRDVVREKGGPECQGRLLGIWWVEYLYGAARGLGLIYALCGMPMANRRKSNFTRGGVGAPEK